MENLLLVLGVLFLVLLILVPLLERFKGSLGEPRPGLMKWIFPLLALVIVLRLLQHYLG